MGLIGIDISSWQDDLVVSAMGTCDFVIVKATGGAGYSNECFRRHADETLAAGKLLGCYHYARDRGYEGSVEAESDHFINAFKPYIGKAIPFLDWEADALGLGVAWAKAWLDRVKAKTGVTPGIYMSKGNCREYDWTGVAKAYPLWVAQYAGYEPTGYQKDPWTDSYGYGAWSKPALFQYSSEGHVKGYYARLDINLFYGGKDAFKALMGPQTAPQPSQTPNPQAKLAVDGIMGPLTIGELQRQLGVATTKTMDKATVKALQRRLGVAVDGVMGPKTRKALQRKLGVRADGVVGRVTVKSLQQKLNAGEVEKW